MAAVFTVGPDGEYGQFSSAVTAALAAGPGRHEVRLQLAEHLLTGTVSIPLSSGRDLVMTGGWDADFQVRETGPEGSSLRGDGTFRLVRVTGSAGRLSLEGLTLRAGRNGAGGGLMQMDLGGGASAQLNEVAFRDGESQQLAGCLGINASQQAALTLRKLSFKDCRVLLNQPFFVNQASGLWAYASDSARITIRHLSAEGNQRLRPSADGSLGGVVAVVADGDAEIDASHLRLVNNQTSFMPTGLAIGPAGAGLYAAAPWNLPNTQPRIRLSELELSNNICLCTDMVGVQAQLSGNIRVENALITQGQRGMLLGTSGPNEAFLSHLTISQHSENGLRITAFSNASGVPSVLLANSILFGNVTDYFQFVFGEAQITQTANFVTQDPGFLDPANGNFRLQETGPAANTGLRELSQRATDLDGLPRDYGSNVDPGAYESRPWPPQIVRGGRHD